jgi:6-phosphogluconolactonase/glucosamine-6-phosphate isomerase/deaminase
MGIIIQATPEAATDVAAAFIARMLREKPDAVLGLATGSTPLLGIERAILGTAASRWLTDAG